MVNELADQRRLNADSTLMHLMRIRHRYSLRGILFLMLQGKFFIISIFNLLKPVVSKMEVLGHFAK